MSLRSACIRATAIHVGARVLARTSVGGTPSVHGTGIRVGSSVFLFACVEVCATVARATCVHRSSISCATARIVQATILWASVIFVFVFLFIVRVVVEQVWDAVSVVVIIDDVGYAITVSITIEAVKDPIAIGVIVVVVGDAITVDVAVLAVGDAVSVDVGPVACVIWVGARPQFIQVAAAIAISVRASERADTASQVCVDVQINRRVTDFGRARVWTLEREVSAS